MEKSKFQQVKEFNDEIINLEIMAEAKDLPAKRYSWFYDVINEELTEFGEAYDKDDNIIDASGSDYIINVVKDKQFNKAKVLVKYIESYFEDNGGKC